MGNSCVSAGCCRGSNQVQTTFKWTIDGFSSLLDRGAGLTYSNVFQTRGLNWHLKLNPMDTKSGDPNEYVSLQLELTRDSVRSRRVVKTTFKFLIYDQLYGKHYEQQASHDFQSKSTTFGTSCMIPLTALKEKSSGFLVNDTCVICVQFISVAIDKTKDVLENLFVQKMKNSEPQVYTWNIDDFFALENPSYSPEFELCGYKWSIKIYPSGDDTDGNHLSLYLVLKVPDTLQENSAKLVESTVSIKTLEAGKPFTKAKGREEYSEYFDGWGWDKFISLEDFKDPANGYLVKAKCCIQVQVAVIGSSEMK